MKKYFILSLNIFFFIYISVNINKNKNEFNFNFKYQYFEREIITRKIKKYSNWMLWDDHPYFINGILRKIKPKKCLEIGVAKGGSTIVILNAIKDIKDSSLVSLDLNTQLYINSFSFYLNKIQKN